MLSLFFKPYSLFLIMSLLSFLMWAYPISENLYIKGFEYNQSLLSVGGLFAFDYIVSIFLISYIFFHIGTSTAKSFIIKKDNKINKNNIILKEKKIYLFFTFIALIGVLYTYYIIIKRAGRFNIIIYMLLNNNGNFLKEILYEDYSIGLFSLRYVAIISFAMALYFLFRRKYYFLNLLNIILLFAVALISSRLSLVMAVLIGLYLNKDMLKKYRFKLGLILIIVTILLVIFNFLRNANYYYQYNIYNPFTMFLAQFVSYLGTTFQGLLTVGNFSQVWNINNLEDQIYFTHIANNYTTNSAALFLVGKYGYLGLIILLLTISITSFYMGLIYKKKNILSKILYGVLLYCYFDLYRIFMFNQGITLTLISIIISFSLFSKIMFNIKINFLKEKNISYA